MTRWVAGGGSGGGTFDPNAPAVTAVLAPRKSEAHDDFTTKPNGSTLTALDSGQSYETYANNPATAFTLSSGYLTHALLASGPSAAYAGAQLADRVGRIWCDFVIPSAGTGTPEDLVLIVSTGQFAQSTFSDAASHFVIGQTDWSYQTLDADPFGTTVVAAGSFSTPLATDVVHTVAVDFLGDRAAITLPGGHRTVLTAPTPKILGHRGAHATVELYANDSALSKPIHIQAWGADNETATSPASPFASRGDLVRALDPIPPAPRAITYGANPAVDFPIGTDQGTPDPNIAVVVEYPTSGQVMAEITGFFYPSNGANYTGNVYAWLMNGTNTRGGGTILYSTEGMRTATLRLVLTGTPGTAETLTLALSADSAGIAHFASNGPGGVLTVLSTTPLA